MLISLWLSSFTRRCRLAHKNSRQTKHRLLTRSSRAFIAQPGAVECLEDRTLLSVVDVLTEGFEGSFPTDNSWQVGDSNSDGTEAYWDDVNAAFGGEGTHSGSRKGYVAATGHAGTDTHPTYQNFMTAFMQTTIDLSTYSSAELSFWYKTPSIESFYDIAQVYIDSTKVWESDFTQTSWIGLTIDLDSYVGSSHILKFEFVSDVSITNEGWYLDDILVTAETDVDDRFDDNDTVGTAWNFGPRTSEFTETNLQGSDDDWYQFTTVAAGGSTDDVTIAFTDSLGDLDLYVYHSDGTTLWGSSTGGTNTETVSLNNAPQGTYYVKVDPFRRDMNPNYSLTIDPPMSLEDRFEENDTLETAWDFGTGRSEFIETNLQGFDDDWYQFTTVAAGGSTDDVTITFTDSLGDLDLYVYHSDGTTLWGSSTGGTDTETVSLNNAPQGTYYVKVDPFSSDMNPDYSLTIDPPLDDLGEENDTLATAFDFGLRTSELPE